ncbi:MAG: DUF4177 domain-containing protein [Arcicella sp.]|nr:DUF4177 domain-containing protein [Arcicella sp.]
MFHQKISFKSDPIVENAKIGIQEKLDEYASKGYILHHTFSMDFADGIYTTLYFEKDV